MLVDGQVLGLAAEKALRAALVAVGAVLRTDVDVFSEVWANRPGLPSNAVFEHLPPFATQTRAEKLTQVRRAMTQNTCSLHFVSSVDDIAWILNLQGADVSYNPVFISHMLVSATDATLFVADGKIDAALTARLSADGVAIGSFAQAPAALAAAPAGTHILVEPRRVTFGLRQNLAASVVVVEAINPSTLLKAAKILPRPNLCAKRCAKTVPPCVSFMRGLKRP